MCGIAGIYHLQTAKPVDPARLRVMLNGMTHRGGGAAGEWTAAGVGLGYIGHEKAANAEESRAAQPLKSDNEAATIVFDGLLLNRATLRAELDDRGHRLPHGTDAELVLAAWRQWGTDSLTRLEGLFAFAIHDHGRGSLFLARDRLGGRPLHMALLSDGALAFASELKGLLRHPLLPRQANLTAAEDFLALGYVPDDNCLLAGVEKLAAGHYLLLQRGKAVEPPICWWAPDFSRRVRASEAEAADYLSYLLRNVVRDYQRAAPHNGLLLSGGLDSGALLALLAESSPRAVESMTLRSAQRVLDEETAAAALAERFAGHHRSLAAPAISVAMVDAMADAFDEPCADLDVPWLLSLSGSAGAEFCAGLVGHGADEIFAGSRRMVFHHQEEKLRGRIPGILRRMVIGPLARALPQGDWAPHMARRRARMASLAQSGTHAYARAVARTGPARRVRIFNDAAVRALGHHIGEGRYWRAMGSAAAREALDRAQHAEWTIAVPGALLMKLDRIGAACDLPLLAPYMDHRVAEFVMALPASMRVKKDGGKAIFRRAMTRHVPKALADQQRSPWEAPVSQWFRGPLAAEARRLALSATLVHTGWFDMAEIGAVVDAHQSGRADHGPLIWQILLLEKSFARLFDI